MNIEKGGRRMIWWVGAGILYIIVLAAICLFFEGAKEPPDKIRVGQEYN
jgi:hypothetical protein